MSKKTQKKSSKIAPRKPAAAAPGKTSAAKKRPVAKKRSAATKKPASAKSKRPQSVATKASQQLASKPLKLPPKPAAALAAAAKPKTANPTAPKPLPETVDAPIASAGGLVEGAKAPAFRLPRDGGETVSLADFAGQKLYIGPTIGGPEPPRPSRTQVEVYDPDSRNGVNGHTPSGTGSCPWQGFRC